MLKKGIVWKVIISVVLLAVACGALLILNHPAKNGRKTTVRVPELVENPVYVTCEPGKTVTAKLTPKRDLWISGLEVLLVNLSAESTGGLSIWVKDETGSRLLEQTLQVGALEAGNWIFVEGEMTLEAGKTYEVDFLTDSSEPYFMKLEEYQMENLPFAEQVTKGDQVEQGGISIGVAEVESVHLTFGKILYFSIPVTVLLTVLCLIWIWLGTAFYQKLFSRIPFSRIGEQYFPYGFLLLVFVTLALGVLTEGYQKGVYITSDSAGYLREAVALVSGQGFSYDGLAGYESWFANWPIIYPAGIALVKVLTGTEIFLASKLFTILCIGILLVLLERVYKKDAWFYSLILLNAGFVELTYYTWSEIPFMVFLFCFAVLFGEIVATEKPTAKTYVALGVFGFLVFMTRYFGIYIWIAVAGYLVLLGYLWLSTKDSLLWKKIRNLTGTAFVSGMFSVLYLLCNKIKNGNASGVSRTMWWDDYEKLTNDLVDSLWTEVCNIFSVSVPKVIEDFSYPLKVLAFFAILLGLIVFVSKQKEKLSREGAFVYLGVAYYVIFIGIRYFSSMDTFYFRFFEPATFLISFGLFGWMYPKLKGKPGTWYLGIFVTCLLCFACFTRITEKPFAFSDSYYASLQQKWNQDYTEIPEKSVVIFSDLDFRSSFYRPDVVSGDLRPEDTFAILQERFYGSDFMCLRLEDAKVMLETGDYDDTVAKVLQEAVGKTPIENRFVVVSLR